jgi:hypothetical protein
MSYLVEIKSKQVISSENMSYLVEIMSKHVKFGGNWAKTIDLH